MKNLLTTVIILLWINLINYAQVPDAFNYQAVLRNNSGEAIQNKEISVRITILSGSTDGQKIYAESQDAKTNSLGLFNLNIGEGYIEYGDFSEIDWGDNSYFLNVEVDPEGGFDYFSVGTTQLFSVPYALQAKKSNYSDIATELDKDVLYFPESDTLFAVKDHDGNIVFAVFPDGAKVYVNNTTKGKVGGFAVTGRNPGKAETEEEYLVVTPDSTRVWVNESIKGKVGGFAVTGRNPGKGLINDYLQVTKDSTRIYVEESTKGPVGGFAITGRNPGKANSSSYMNITRDNYFIGHESGQDLVDGLFNSTLGFQSGYSLTNGESNAYVGYQSGYNTKTGSGNLFIGYQTGFSNQVGNYNSFLGYQAGYSNTDGLFNTFLGSYSGYSNQIGNNNTFVGDSSGFYNTGNSNSFFGTKTGLKNKTGIQNVFIGNMCGYGNTSGLSNVLIGNQAGYLSNSSYNVLIGNKAGYLNGGSSNVFIGFEAGRDNSIGSSNVYLGRKSGNINTSGSQNVFIGDYAGLFNTNGDGNVFIGKDAGYANSTGDQNIYIGLNAGNASSSAWLNIAIGALSGINSNGTSNIMLGTKAGYNDSDGIRNLYLGTSAGYNNVHGYKNVFIGNEAGYYSKSSDKLYIENSDADSTRALIYGEFDTDILRVNDYLGIGRRPASNNLEVQGTASKNTAGDWLANSDRRIKTDIQDIENSFEIVLKLRPVKFKYTDYWKLKHKDIKDQYYYNFIAQEYQQVFPESVKGSGEYIKGDDQEILQLDSYNAQIVTIKAVQDLIIENEDLKERVKKLEDIVNKLLSE